MTPDGPSPPPGGEPGGEQRDARSFDRLAHRFDGRSPTTAVLAAGAELEPGEESEVMLRLAGRILGRRGQGKLVFLELQDLAGRVQLLASRAALSDEAFGVASRVSLGDILGVAGRVIRTRRGEVSLALDAAELLAPNRLPLPDTWSGLRDVEQRYRQRYLDLLISADARELALRRSRLVSAIRGFMDARGFAEVETPILQPLYGGAAARPFTTHHNQLDRTFYLRIATELYLKRLIVGGLEKVYEIGRTFRNEGVSFKHNPEFTMLESYEAYADYTAVMAMTEELIATAARAALGTTVVETDQGPVDLAPPWPRIRLGEAIAGACGIDPFAGPRDPDALRERLHAAGVDTSRDRTWAQLVDHLLSHFVEPTVTAPVFLVDYPVELSPLARGKQDEPGMTERFEAFCAGMELANGYSELNDPAEQRARFEEQAAAGRAGDEDAHPVDQDYVRALSYGMPPTGGLGVGIDRLAMLLLGRPSIREVVLFPALRDAPPDP